jgi:hypothetical protein
MRPDDKTDNLAPLRHVCIVHLSRVKVASES